MPEPNRVRLGHAIGAFLEEHRGCWRLYGEGLESAEDGVAVWLEYPACDAQILFGLRP